MKTLTTGLVLNVAATWVTPARPCSILNVTSSSRHLSPSHGTF